MLHLLILAVLIGAAVLLFKSSDGGSRAGISPHRQQWRASQQSAPNATHAYEIVLARAPDGHYYVTAEVEGVPVDFLVDTGASVIALTRADAERIGLRPEGLDYSQQVQTANGIAYAAPVTLGTVTIEKLRFRNVSAAVSQGNIGMSLLGMSLLSRLKGYRFEDGKLLLCW